MKLKKENRLFYYSLLPTPKLTLTSFFYSNFLRHEVEIHDNTNNDIKDNTLRLKNFKNKK